MGSFEAYKESLPIKEGIISEPEILGSLMFGNISRAIELKKISDVSDKDFIKLAEEGFRKNIGNSYSESDYIRYEEAEKELGISPEKIREIVEEKILEFETQDGRFSYKNDKSGFFYKIAQIAKIYRIESNFLKDSRFSEPFKKYIIEALGNGADYVLDLMSQYGIDSSFLETSDARKAIKLGLVKEFSRGGARYYSSRIKRFNLTDQYIKSQPELREAINEGIVSDLIYGHHDAEESAREFGLNDEEFRLLVIEAINRFLGLSSKVPLINDFEGALKLKERYKITNTDLGLGEEGFKPLVIAEIKRLLSKFGVHIGDEALNLKEKYGIGNEVFNRIIRDNLIKFLKEDLITEAQELTEKFSVVKNDDIIDSFPDIKFFLIKILARSKFLYSKIIASQEFLIDIFRFRNDKDQFLKMIDENPFLIDAVTENPKFGIKLLLKFPSLDDLSKENIVRLYKAKKELLEDDPNLDVNSLEFGIGMNDKLFSDKELEELKDEFRGIGIDVDRWLNYAGVEEFKLIEEEVSFADTIQTPMTRLVEVIEKEVGSMRVVFTKYKSLLDSQKMINPDFSTLQGMLAKRKSELKQAEISGNAQKISGLKIAVDKLETRVMGEEEITVGDHLLELINRRRGKAIEVRNANTALVKAEQDLKGANSNEELRSLKQKAAAAKGYLIEKYADFIDFEENYMGDNLLKTLRLAVGREDSLKIIEEASESVREDIVHYEEDVETLSALFVPKSKHFAELKGNEMEIRVWTRNPDVDLYQGNYSSCCVSIDNDVHRNSSPITDYLTDAAIQVVNIWDKTKNIPVVAAWLWLGKNEEGEPVMVIDNIEANTNYSIHFPGQLWEKLSNYLKDYARLIGVKKLVLGTQNNDLPTASEMGKLSDTSSASKMGGYHRPGGYYLEADSLGDHSANKLKLIYAF